MPWLVMSPSLTLTMKIECLHCPSGSAWPSFLSQDIDLHCNGCTPVPYRKAPIGIEYALSCLTVLLMRNLTFGPRILPVCLQSCVCVRARVVVIEGRFWPIAKLPLHWIFRFMLSNISEAQSIVRLRYVPCFVFVVHLHPLSEWYKGPPVCNASSNRENCMEAGKKED